MKFDLPENDLIEGCIKQDRKCQEMLYRLYSKKMFGVCLGYSKDHSIAKDLLQEGFIRIFNNIHHFKKDGSLEGWIRRVIVNVSIDNYRKSIRLFNTVELNPNDRDANLVDDSVLDKINMDDLLRLIQQLPEGYRIVFNLYVIEGYSHKEISEQLQISEGTSKSQLSRAKKYLQEKILKHYDIKLSDGTDARQILQLV